ncbi:hypothetical protein ACLOJK_020207 [Asimina triloba]
MPGGYDPIRKGMATGVFSKRESRAFKPSPQWRARESSSPHVSLIQSKVVL